MSFKMKDCFRGFFPIVVDLETGGLNAKTDALLEIAAYSLKFNEDNILVPDQVFAEHVIPFEGANLDPKSIAFLKIDPFHPFRFAISEQEALKGLFSFIKEQRKNTECQKAVLVAHNAWFDLGFINAAIERNNIKKNPFHPFTCFDTATIGGVMFGQTVLSKAITAIGLEFNNDEAHSAKYDAYQAALIFCAAINRWYACRPALK